MICVLFLYLDSRKAINICKTFKSAQFQYGLPPTRSIVAQAAAAENQKTSPFQAGAWTDIFLGGATSKFARGARENFIALHLDFIALHLGVERYKSRWSAIKFSRATKNVTQHLN